MKKNYADMDPLEELREIRKEIMRKHKTVEAYCDYLMKAYPVNPPAEPQAKGRRTSSAKAKANTRPAMRQRKTAAHA